MSTVFSPMGLQSVKTSTSAAYTGQTETFFIKSKYDQNIFKGDAVVIDQLTALNLGYLANFSDNLANMPMLGVFVDCKYTSPANANSGFTTTSAGSPYFAEGTESEDGTPIAAEIMIDNSILYTAQVAVAPGNSQNSLFVGGKPGPVVLANLPVALNNLQELVGKSIGIGYVTNDGTAGGTVSGNVNTGNSMLYLNAASAKAPSANADTNPFIVIGISADPGLNSGEYVDGIYTGAYPYLIVKPRTASALNLHMNEINKAEENKPLEFKKAVGSK